MTLDDIESMDKQMLLATDIAPLLGCNAHCIRVQAQYHPEKLGFPVVVQGTRVRIPKCGFLRYMRHGNATNHQGQR